MTVATGTSGSLVPSPPHPATPRIAISQFRMGPPDRTPADCRLDAGGVTSPPVDPFRRELDRPPIWVLVEPSYAVPSRRSQAARASAPRMEICSGVGDAPSRGDLDLQLLDCQSIPGDHQDYAEHRTTGRAAWLTAR